MAQIPRDKSPDSSLALFLEGYNFTAKRFRRYRSDIFETRLMLSRGLSPSWLSRCMNTRRAESNSCRAKRVTTSCSCRKFAAFTLSSPSSPPSSDGSSSGEDTASRKAGR